MRWCVLIERADRFGTAVRIDSRHLTERGALRAAARWNAAEAADRRYVADAFDRAIGQQHRAVAERTARLSGLPSGRLAATFVVDGVEVEVAA
jgi:hypothetical protein